MKRGPELALAGSACLSHREIADRLGIPKSQVEVLEKRALAKMRRVLARCGISRDDLLGDVTSEHDALQAMAAKRGA